MRPTPAIRRTIVLVLDGLRPDAIDVFELPHLQRLRRRSASTMSATTVAPSVTWPAMTSLLTGVSPQTHGIICDHPHLPRPRAPLTPLPRLLSDAGLPTSAFMAEVPLIYRGLATRIARRLGFAEARFAGKSAPEILFTARQTLERQRSGFILLHWPDADRAGHEYGWMSAEYGIAARRMDAAAGLLASLTDVVNDPETLLIMCADHGGGGVVADNHDSAHPLDRTIPVMLLGGRVSPTELEESVGLLDIPATVLWALGIAVPSSFTGRPLDAAFEAREPAGRGARRTKETLR